MVKNNYYQITRAVLLGWLLVLFALPLHAQSPDPSAGEPSGGTQSDNVKEVVIGREERPIDRNAEITENFTYGVEAVVSPRIFGELVNGLFGLLAGDSANAIDGTNTEGRGGVATTLQAQLSRWAPRSGHLFTPEQRKSLSSALTAIIIPIFGIAALTLVAELLYGLAKGSSAVFSLVVEEVIALCIVFVITTNSHVLVGQVYQFTNRILATVCAAQAVPSDSGDSVQASITTPGVQGGCDKSDRIASALMPSPKERAFMNGFIIGLFVISSVLAAAFAYAGQVIRLLVGSFLLVLAPICFAAESLRFTRGLARGWAVAAFIYGVSLLGSAAILLVYDQILGPGTGALVQAVPQENWNERLIQSLGATAVLFIVMLVSAVGLLVPLPVLGSMANLAFHGLRTAGAYSSRLFGAVIGGGDAGGGGGAPAPAGNSTAPAHLPSGQQASSSAPSTPVAPKQFNKQETASVPIEKQTVCQLPTPYAYIQSIFQSIGLSSPRPEATKAIGHLLNGGLAFGDENGNVRVVSPAVGHASVQYASMMARLSGENREALLKNFDQRDASLGFAKLSTLVANHLVRSPAYHSVSAEKGEKPSVEREKPSLQRLATQQAESLLEEYIQVPKPKAIGKPEPVSPGRTEAWRESTTQLQIGAGRESVAQMLSQYGLTVGQGLAATNPHPPGERPGMSQHQAPAAGASNGSLLALSSDSSSPRPTSSQIHTSTAGALSSNDDKPRSSYAPPSVVIGPPPVTNGHAFTPASPTLSSSNDVRFRPPDAPSFTSSTAANGQPSSQIVIQSSAPSPASIPAHWNNEYRQAYRSVVEQADRIWSAPEWRDDQRWGKVTPYAIHHAISIEQEWRRLRPAERPPEIERVVEWTADLHRTYGPQAVESVGQIMRASKDFEEFIAGLQRLIPAISERLSLLFGKEAQRFEKYNSERPILR